MKSEKRKIALTRVRLLGFFFLLFSFLLFAFFLSFFLSFFFCSSCPGDAGNTVAGRLQLVELIQHRNKERTDGTGVDISVAGHKLLAYGNDKMAL